MEASKTASEAAIGMFRRGETVCGRRFGLAMMGVPRSKTYYLAMAECQRDFWLEQLFLTEHWRQVSFTTRRAAL
jgi:hypothetical protein